MNAPLISITILTYNQEKYISRCIDSVLSQETTYPYEIIIGEDCSTDGTRTICQHYVDTHKNIQLLTREKNVGVTKNWIDCVRHSSGEYLMMLDGDDWWHNPHKIQMQINLMVQHPKCVLCHTSCDILNARINKIKHSTLKIESYSEQQIFNELMDGTINIISSTCCIRAQSLYSSVPLDIFEQEDFPCEDWPTFVFLSRQGSTLFLPESTATYQKGLPSVSRQTDFDTIRNYSEKSLHMCKIIHDLIPELGPFKDEEYFTEQMYNSLLIAAYSTNNFLAAKEFSKKIKKPNVFSLFAYNKCTFHLLHLIKCLHS